MDTNDLEAAVRLVLPALNLEPAQFQLDPGFITRAQRRRTPSAVVLNQPSYQLVFAGLRPKADPNTAVATIAGEALASLSAASRSVCERLIVAWADPQDQAFAAALVVSPSGVIGELLGSSWSPPETWPEPMIDIRKPEHEAIDDALAGLEPTINNRRDLPKTAFHRALERALRLVDLTLLRVGGEGQDASTRPSAGSSDESWGRWLKHYSRSVRDEWSRARHVPRISAQSTAQLPEDGPLAGLKVFLSYARPDATSMAWPVYEALSSCGASVWFDQEQQPDEQSLDFGLEDTIARCDAYVMCATDEFVERAGYATQEFAWAIRQWRSGGKMKHFVAVVKPGTLLPSAIVEWPAVEFHGSDREGLVRGLMANLQNVRPHSQMSAPHGRPPMVARPATPPLAIEADMAFLRTRAQHVIGFDEIDQRGIEKLASSDQAEHDMQVMAVRRRLLRAGEGLEWSGTLQDIDQWPKDPLVRDMRLRLGSSRAVAGTRWPLNDERDSGSSVAADVECLAMRPVPLLEWQAEQGWDDSARRFALRHHSGLLRLLQQLLRRGLTGGIFEVPFSMVDEWVEQISKRRRECSDTILDLRLEGCLSWQSDPPAWDAIFRSWHEFLTATDRPSRTPVPFSVIQLLGANAIDLAAAGAETCWYASRYPGLASQSLTVINAFGPRATADVYASKSAAIESSKTRANHLRLGLVAIAGGSAEIRLTWNQLLFSSGSIAAGESSSPAPTQLDRAINFLRS